MDMHVYKQANNKITVPETLIKSTLEKIQDKTPSSSTTAHSVNPFKKRLLWTTATLVPCTCLIIFLICHFYLGDSIYINKVTTHNPLTSIEHNLGTAANTSMPQTEYIDVMELSSVISSIQVQCPTLLAQNYVVSTDKTDSILTDKLQLTYAAGDKQISLTTSSTQNLLADYNDLKKSNVNGRQVILLQTDATSFSALYQTEKVAIRLDFMSYEKQAFLSALELLIK